MDNISLEKKVQDLILQKLYVKVIDEYIFIDKEVFIGLLLQDIITLALNDLDVSKAIAFRNAQPGIVQKPEEILRNELQEIIDYYSCELDAYQAYRDYLEEGLTASEIVKIVNQMLNIDYDFFEQKLHALTMDSLSPKLTEEEAAEMGTTKERLLDLFAHQVKLIACNPTIEDAVEEAFSEFENYPKKALVKKDGIRNELVRFSKVCPDEINAYKMAMSLHEQNAEMAMVFATYIQLLNLE